MVKDVILSRIKTMKENLVAIRYYEEAIKRAQKSWNVQAEHDGVHSVEASDDIAKELLAKLNGYRISTHDMLESYEADLATMEADDT